MTSLRPFLFVASVLTSLATLAADPSGLLVIRNGSNFATLSVQVYHLESENRSMVKEATIGPVSTHAVSLPAGDYLATFSASNATQSISEGRFSLGAGEDYTINFQPKDKP